MWITGDVELPEEVLDAYERGELVFFVGAGASLDAPSNLPLFSSLAEQLAERANHPFEPKRGLDYFIGKLESLPQRFDAHRHAHKIISSPGSNFNSIHESIAELAHNSGAFKVVTTNYDDHLASATKGISEQVPDVWYGPALPLGNHFEGIVHLHGSIRRPYKEIILSDRDFGAAYLTEAWATRFLLPMFSRFTVVFIGYSHDDTIMRYLALGLPIDNKGKLSKRFAFTNEPDNDKWQYLGIRPIGYPAPNHDHRALPEALNAWSNRVKMGKVDHRARLLNIVSGGTQITPPDHDYLCARLMTEDGARDFLYATGKCSDDQKLDWLDWVKLLDQFETLFQGEVISRSSEILADWFAKNFIESPALNGAALQAVHQMGQSMSDCLFQVATRSANVLHQKDKESGLRWQTLLSTSIRGQSAPMDTSNLMPITTEGSDCGLPLLSVSLRPSLVMKKRFFIDEKDARKQYPDAEVSWKANEYILTEHVNQAVAISVPGDFSLGSVLIQSITEGYLLLNAYHGLKDFDVLSFHRSAIEPHEQDDVREPIDALIDGLRDYGLKALSVYPSLPEQWWSSQHELMQRLAIYLVANDESRSPDQKLKWLTETVGLYRNGVKHESYQLLKRAFSGASLAQKKLVLAVAEIGPDYPEDTPNREQHIAYAKFNLLAWITQVAPSCEEARVRFERAQQEYPDFRVRENPDFDYWSTGVSWVAPFNLNVDDFLITAEEDSEVAFDDLISQQDSRPTLNGPNWDDTYRLIEKVAEQRPGVGLKFWDANVKHGYISNGLWSIGNAIISGWGKAELGDSELEIIKKLQLSLSSSNSDTTDAIANFLLDQGRRQVDCIESLTTAEMRKLAKSLWDLHGDSYSSYAGAEPLSSVMPSYLNSWPGKLARYWGSEVERRWRQNRDVWDGLNSEETDALTSLLGGNADVLDSTQPAIAGQLFFYFAADEEFATQYLLPLFDESERHAYAWSSYLHHPRCNDRLLGAGLLDSINNEFARLQELPDQQVRQAFMRLVISVISEAEISSSERDKLLAESIIADDGAHAVDFVKAVAWFIRDDEIDAVAIWDRWFGKHLRNRVDGIPRTATAEELEAWADLVPYLDLRIPDALDVLSEQSVGFAQNSFYLEIPSYALETYGDKLVAFLAERVRSTPESASLLGCTISRLAESVQKIVGQERSQPIIDAAVDKGFIVPFE